MARRALPLLGDPPLPRRGSDDRGSVRGHGLPRGGLPRERGRGGGGAHQPGGFLASRPRGGILGYSYSVLPGGVVIVVCAGGLEGALGGGRREEASSWKRGGVWGRRIGRGRGRAIGWTSSRLLEAGGRSSTRGVVVAGEPVEWGSAGSSAAAKSKDECPSRWSIIEVRGGGGERREVETSTFCDCPPS